MKSEELKNALILEFSAKICSTERIAEALQNLIDIAKVEGQMMVTSKWPKYEAHEVGLIGQHITEPEQVECKFHLLNPEE